MTLRASTASRAAPTGTASMASQPPIPAPEIDSAHRSRQTMKPAAARARAKTGTAAAWPASQITPNSLRRALPPNSRPHNRPLAAPTRAYRPKPYHMTDGLKDAT